MLGVLEVPRQIENSCDTSVVLLLSISYASSVSPRLLFLPRHTSLSSTPRASIYRFEGVRNFAPTVRVLAIEFCFQTLRQVV